MAGKVFLPLYKLFLGAEQKHFTSFETLVWRLHLYIYMNSSLAKPRPYLSVHTVIVPDNGLLRVRRRAIIRTSIVTLLIGLIRTYQSESNCHTLLPENRFENGICINGSQFVPIAMCLAVELRNYPTLAEVCLLLKWLNFTNIPRYQNMI